MAKKAKTKSKIWTYAMEQMPYPDVQAIVKTTKAVLISIGSQERRAPHVPLAAGSSGLQDSCEGTSFLGSLTAVDGQPFLEPCGRG